jgi:rubrerythrin
MFIVQEERTMNKVNSDVEILEFAIHRETEAYNLFTALAERVADPTIRRLLEELAGEELEHKDRLELEMIKIGKTVPPAEPSLPISVGDYIVTNDPAQLDMDYKDVLMMCMQKEESTFRIYIDMIPKAANERLREMLIALAQEEVKHKMRFQADYEALLKNPR